jgi:hypothetical protein
MLAPIVYGNRQTHHIRQNHGTAGPGLDRPFTVVSYRLLHLFKQVGIDEWSFLD